MNDNTGGPAFPRPASEAHQHGMHSPQEGMTLRDYFAAHAMQGGIGLIPHMKNPRANITVPQAVAEMAYEYADAMLEARK